MLPKIPIPLAESLVLEDHMKDLAFRFRNENYAKFKGKHLHKQFNTPFGDFPKNKSRPPQKCNISLEINERERDSKMRISTEPVRKNKELTKSVKLPKISKDKPICGAYLPRDITTSEFRKIYDRGDIPFKIDYQGSVKKLIWKQDPKFLDYHHYLPIFIDGLREKFDPYRYLAVEGTIELIEKAPEKIPAVVPQLILPLKTNLNTRDHDIIRINLIILQKIILTNSIIGQILVPYYRQLLPIMNLFKNKNTNIGDKFEYSQRKNQNLGDLIDETLQILETNGGENAYINIKYMIPTYESCVFA